MNQKNDECCFESDEEFEERNLADELDFFNSEEFYINLKKE